MLSVGSHSSSDIHRHQWIVKMIHQKRAWSLLAWQGWLAHGLSFSCPLYRHSHNNTHTILAGTFLLCVCFHIIWSPWWTLLKQLATIMDIKPYDVCDTGRRETPGSWTQPNASFDLQYHKLKLLTGGFGLSPSFSTMFLRQWIVSRLIVCSSIGCYWSKLPPLLPVYQVITGYPIFSSTAFHIIW